MNYTYTLTILQMVLQCANCIPQTRLFKGTVLTEEQLDSNFQGSASIAFVEDTNVAGRYRPGVLIKNGTFVSAVITAEQPRFSKLYVSQLVLLDSTYNRPVYQEPYTCIGPTSASTAKLDITSFSPLPANSKGVVATRPPAGSQPPPKGTSGCVAFAYGKIDTGFAQSVNYVPLVIRDPVDCHITDIANSFCATVSNSEGKQPVCTEWDAPLMAFCPSSSVRRLAWQTDLAPNKGITIGINLCQWFSWWWWCPSGQQPNPPEGSDEWIFIGLWLAQASTITSTCGTANTKTPQLLIFEYTANFPSV